MISKRIIPILLLKNEDIVKTVNYKNPKYIGDPINIIKIFNEKTVDELILINIESTRYNKDINFDFLEKVAGECHMPITYGGGIKKIEDADKIFNLGIEKISLNYSIINNSLLLNEISTKFGSQSVIASIDLNMNFFKKIKLYNYITNKNLDIDIYKYIQNCIDSGAGEILINLVHNEGSLGGIDSKFLNNFNNNFKLPIILHGGINSIDNINQIFDYNYDAVGIGSFFIFQGPHKAVLISYPEKYNYNK